MTTNKRLCLATAIAGLFVMLSPTAFGDLFGIEYDTGHLHRISVTDGSMTYIGDTGLGGNYGPASLEYNVFDSGQLYAFTTGSYNDPYGVPDAKLYSIDPSTAATTEIGPLGLPTFVSEGGLAFSPAGVAYGVNTGSWAGGAELFTINLGTGAATSVGNMGPGVDVNGLAWRSDGMLVGIERPTNSLVQIDPSTAVMTVIATLEPAVGASGGMAAIGDTGYFACGNDYSTIPGANALFTIDLYTGAHELVGSFDPWVTGIGIGGLALPEPGSLALLVLAGLAAARRRR
ncbi:MAG: PEP-CTERM sorting domain-containing protein [Planctomycetota bacterium]